jgi:hypothetical protein
MMGLALGISGLEEKKSCRDINPQILVVQGFLLGE